MIILVVGASGATGKLLVQQLLDGGETVKVVIRAESVLPETIATHKKLTIIRANILDLDEAEASKLVEDCDAIACCLGHNLTFKGIFGYPRRLVTDTTRNLCNAVKTNSTKIPTKFVLMNTTGNSNRDIPERVSFGQLCVTWLLRLLLPPHIDNEQAADFLRCDIAQDNSRIEWVAVRPDGLTNENEVSEYKVYPSPIRNAIFDAGTTSRINVAHFMAKLITDTSMWNEWKGQMPVIYNAEGNSS